VTAFIFLGPTLAQDEARPELDAIYLPPVAQGDVYRAAKERPFAIGIIDGYFERLPSVWHKEILWALSQGIHVFGGSSMGALRAAELDRFGMRGIGEIYRAFAAGELEDDDEVAVTHGDVSTGYRATSEAMVNIRATLIQAERAHVLSAELRSQFEALAKHMFYPERSYPHLLASGLEQGLPKREIEALRGFLLANRVDQKRADAVALLRAVRECCVLGTAPKPSTFPFQHTEAWDQVVDWAETQPPIGQDSQVSVALLAAEIRLLGPRGRAVLAGGLNRAVAGVLARRRGVGNIEARIAKLDQVVRQRATADAANNNDAGHEQRFRSWLEEHALTSESYQGLLEREAQLDWLKERYRQDLERSLVDELRHAGDFVRLTRRAAAKDRVLRHNGLETPTLQDAGLTSSELFEWYFAQRTNHPEPTDFEGFLSEIGLPSVAALQHEALREFVYIKLSGDTQANCEDLKHGTDPGEIHRADAPA
jgi:hypothetical protein